MPAPCGAAGQRLADQPWDRGIGGGVYLGAAVLTLDVDVAWPEHGIAARARLAGRDVLASGTPGS